MTTQLLLRLTFIFLLLAGIKQGYSQSDSLRRRGYLGATVVPLSDSVTLPATMAGRGGVLITEIRPDGSAKAAGLKVGDVLLSITHTPITSTQQFVSLIRKYRAGQQFELQGLRKGKLFTRRVVVRSLPTETHTGFATVYQSVVVHSSKRRLIVTKPNSPGKHPAILFMGGMGCYSLDVLSEEHPYGRILSELTRAGFVTLRVEKTGMGDSEGADCMSPTSDLQQEIDGYIAGLKALKRYSFVDSSQTFILGHSMGGVTAPIVAGKTAVKGIMVSGTIGTSFYEHELDNLRRQLALRKLPDAQIDSLVRLKALCNHRLYVDRQSLDQFRQELSECYQLPIQPSVPYTYMQQAFDLNLSKLWAQVVVPVLVVYGTSDFRTTSEENRYIVNVVNRSHPGHATYIEVPEMEHGFGQAASQQASWNREMNGEATSYHSQFVLELKQWLCTIVPNTCETKG